MEAGPQGPMPGVLAWGPEPLFTCYVPSLLRAHEPYRHWGGCSGRGTSPCCLGGLTCPAERPRARLSSKGGLISVLPVTAAEAWESWGPAGLAWLAGWEEASPWKLCLDF